MTCPLTLEEAYQRLHDAILVLGKKGPDSFGETTVEAARRGLATLQLALLVKMDGIDPSTLQKPSDVHMLHVPLTREAAAILKEISDPEEDRGLPEMVASRVILTWLRQNDFLKS